MRAKIAFPLLVLALTSCDKFELRGFFIPYENANQRFEQSMEWNSMHDYHEIAVPHPSYTIHAMGDTHVGGTKNLREFLTNAQDEGVAAVVMAGDLTTGHHEDFKVFSDQLPSKDDLMYFAMVGNHDIYFDGWKSFYSIFGSSTYYFVVSTPDSSDLFICLDTGGGTLGAKQFDWLKRLLETERSNHRYCIVFTHVNLLRPRSTTSTNPMAEEVHALAALFLEHSINMVVTGHDHKRSTSTLGNTTFITMDALHDSNKRASILILRMSPETVDYSFRELY